MAERIRELIAEPFLIGEEELKSSVSVGVSLYPIDASDSRALLKIADAAMYQSKKRLLGSGLS